MVFLPADRRSSHSSAPMLACDNTRILLITSLPGTSPRAAYLLVRGRNSSIYLACEAHNNVKRANYRTLLVRPGFHLILSHVVLSDFVIVLQFSLAWIRFSSHSLRERTYFKNTHTSTGDWAEEQVGQFLLQIILMCPSCWRCGAASIVHELRWTLTAECIYQWETRSQRQTFQMGKTFCFC